MRGWLGMIRGIDTTQWIQHCPDYIKEIICFSHYKLINNMSSFQCRRLKESNVFQGLDGKETISYRLGESLCAPSRPFM